MRASALNLLEMVKNDWFADANMIPKVLTVNDVNLSIMIAHGNLEQLMMLTNVFVCLFFSFFRCLCYLIYYSQRY